MSKATSAPMCKLCHTAHWSGQPHDRAGIQATRRPPKVPPAGKPKHQQGRGAR